MTTPTAALKCAELILADGIEFMGGPNSHAKTLARAYKALLERTQLTEADARVLADTKECNRLRRYTEPMAIKRLTDLIDRITSAALEAAGCDHKWEVVNKRGTRTYFKCRDCPELMTLDGEPHTTSAAPEADPERKPLTAEYLAELDAATVALAEAERDGTIPLDELKRQLVEPAPAPVTEKPYKGTIKNWFPSGQGAGLGYLIRGEFVDHPDFAGLDGHTSYVVARNGTEIETRNSRYTLSGTAEEADALLIDRLTGRAK